MKIFSAVAKHRHLLVPLSFLAMIVVLIVPLPPVIMDLLICANIALAAIILMTTIYMVRPLDFSVFPALLLATTLFRLVLNVASTRLILSADAQSPEEARNVAGEVIKAFGIFVAGNSQVVGVIIFIILVVVQFIVITKGATRMSEVAARFTLDAMPGKQMAIDADLSAGLIDENSARERRSEIMREADFYGAMDGASKFVRGDAIAGIIITLINIAGGFAIGAFEKGWSMGESLEVFTTLTIGDGLVSQIPSFIIAIAAGLIVARAGDRRTLGDEIPQQLVSQPTALYLISGLLAVLAFSPLPTVPLLGGAVLLGVLAWGAATHARQRVEQKHADARREAGEEKPQEQPIEELLRVDTMEIEVGYGLVQLVDASRGGNLLQRIALIRKQLATELGIVVPPVRIRDNMQLGPNHYRIKIRSATVGSGEVYPELLMAMDSGIANGTPEGIRGREPAFGLDAIWIEPDGRLRAEAMNYTVVDATSVMATHLSEVVRTHASDLLTREEVNHLLEQLRSKAPKLVDEAIPGLLKTGDLQKVLQALLRERVPIRDLETIVETCADWAVHTKDTSVLTEYVRNALRRTISDMYVVPGEDGAAPTMRCVTMDPSVEDMIAGYTERGPAGITMTMPPAVANGIASAVAAAAEPLLAAGNQLIVLTSPTVRAQVRQIIEGRLPGAVVLSYNEIIREVDVESLGLVQYDPQRDRRGGDQPRDRNEDSHEPELQPAVSQ
ncbi:MAG: flagellar biosynthesis protein FlhA [Phycisphaerales bacterium]